MPPSNRRNSRIAALRRKEETIVRRVERNQRAKVARTATKLSKKVFTSSTVSKIKRIRKVDNKQFVIQVKSLLDDGKNAVDMDPTTWTVYMQRQAWMSLGARAGFAMGNTVGQSCTFSCKSERDACILSDCGPGTSWPCGCCIACNLTWLACLADCII